VLLTKKDPMQQGYVFINAINIFKGDTAMQREIIPIIVNNLSSFSEEVIAEAGLTFFELIRQKVSLLVVT
jgi:DNA-binding ferritin-like protein (Dps family)